MNFQLSHAITLLTKPEPTRQDVNAAKTALAIWLMEYDNKNKAAGE